MKKLYWIIPLFLVAVIQLIPVNRPGIIEDNPADLLATTELPDGIANTLKTSCYDCHSDEIEYPWYSYVAPVSWLVARDVREGQEHLNFSRWDSLTKMQKAREISGIIDEVSEEKMPMKIYLVMHPEAKLDENERQDLVAWAGKLGDELFE